jgi:large conductance mechanosensitive channel
LVNDIISPIIGLIAKKDFTELSIQFWDVNFKYGAFLMAILNFFIIAAVLFIIVKMMNNLQNLGKKKKSEAPPAPTTKVCPHCCSEIAIAATRCPHCTSEL